MGDKGDEKNNCLPASPASPAPPALPPRGLIHANLCLLG